MRWAGDSPNALTLPAPALCIHGGAVDRSNRRLQSGPNSCDWPVEPPHTVGLVFIRFGGLRAHGHSPQDGRGVVGQAGPRGAPWARLTTPQAGSHCIRLAAGQMGGRWVYVTRMGFP